MGDGKKYLWMYKTDHDVWILHPKPLSKNEAYAKWCGLQYRRY